MNSAHVIDNDTINSAPPFPFLILVRSSQMQMCDFLTKNKDGTFKSHVTTSLFGSNGCSLAAVVISDHWVVLKLILNVISSRQFTQNYKNILSSFKALGKCY